MKKTVIGFFLSIFFLSSEAQTPEWVVTYGGNPDLTYYVSHMATDKAGNSYVYGINFDTLGNDSGIIIKYNTAGNQVWIIYDSTLSSSFGKIKIDKEGNIYAICRVLGFSFTYDYLTVKYDSSGKFIWRAIYNGLADFSDEPSAIEIDDSLNVYVTGSSDGIGTYHDCLTIKYDSSGKKQWEARYNFSTNPGDQATAIAVDSMHNVYITGSSFDTISGPILTIKYDMMGNEKWVRRHYGGGFSTGLFLHISNDGFIYVGGTDSAPGYSDFLCIKYDSSGNEIWASKYDAQASLSFNVWDNPRAMAVDDSGSVYMAGTQFYGNGVSDDYCTVKFDRNGVKKWVRSYNNAGAWDDIYSLVVDKHNNVYVFGQSQDTSSNTQILATIKYDENGNMAWLAKYPSLPLQRCYAVSISLDSLNNVYISGTQYDLFNKNIRSFITIKYSYATEVKELHNHSSFSIYPNPITSSSTLHFTTQLKNAEVIIYDMLGHVMMRKKMNGDSMEIGRGSLASGVYFVKVVDVDNAQPKGSYREWVEKIVVE